MEGALTSVAISIFVFSVLGVLLGLLWKAIKVWIKAFIFKKVTGFFSDGISPKEKTRYGKKTRDFVGAAYKKYEQGEWSGERKEPSLGRNYSEELMDRGGAYVARTYLMSPSERDVYKVLEKAYGDRYYIMCQVRVVDLIQPNNRKYHRKSKEFRSLFRQISQWHFDYVLCHREDFKFFCALELDDPSHERPDRIKRDRIINRVCEEAGLRLERLVVNHESCSIEVV